MHILQNAVNKDSVATPSSLDPAAVAIHAATFHIHFHMVVITVSILLDAPATRCEQEIEGSRTNS
jgi:hypothetical protein